MPHAAIPFRPHHRFAVPLPRSRRGGLVRLRFLAESRNISFPRRCGGSGERSEPIGALMPHAALWVVQQNYGESPIMNIVGFNAARGFVGGAASSARSPSMAPLVFQCRTRLCGWCSLTPFGLRHMSVVVSMPHAALWVVQPYGIENVSVRRECFNAARGFVGGAASLRKHTKSLHLFQCRTRLCGWCSKSQLTWVLGSYQFQCRTRLCGWCS